MRLEWHAATNVGAVRKVNEDGYFASEALGLWAVADGMGGMSRGDWASAQVVAALGAVVAQPELEPMMAQVARALQQANDTILRETETHGAKIGTTAVALLVRDDQFGVCWVGDSRAYLLRNRQLHQLTRDHSQVQEMVDHGILAPEQMDTHPLRNALTRAVGVMPELVVDAIVDRLEAEDLLLLCSDGLHGVIGDDELRDVLTQMPLREAAEELIGRCHAHGAPDNITMILVANDEVTLVKFVGDAEIAQAVFPT